MTTRMSHPELPGQDITVSDRSVPVHMASGWVPAGDNEEVAAAESAAVSKAKTKSTETGA